MSEMILLISCFVMICVMLDTLYRIYSGKAFLFMLIVPVAFILGLSIYTPQVTQKLYAREDKFKEDIKSYVQEKGIRTGEELKAAVIDNKTKVNEIITTDKAEDGICKVHADVTFIVSPIKHREEIDINVPIEENN